ncbi:DUF4169 family protein [Aliiruegeria lutimaris]|uniref:DUF4169 domain-containing protein n=1 Tax=Aliiruegeria lutimaris TaxID=571298 RepID=A0A1G9B2G9_9RHOB|nr:DUF4169 family protein [Aliiruegeria lutimaris]SDK33737.1 protein of unknown function [Aliiruegeria lutimaris]
MAKPINLNRARKERARKQAREQADRNAVLHGLTKAEKKRARDEALRESKLHEQGRLDPDDTGKD